MHVPSSWGIFACALLCMYSTRQDSDLTGHQSHCGKWKWCSGGEMPGGRLGINSRICDALWSTHLREGEEERASNEGTKWSRRKVFKPLKSTFYNWRGIRSSSNAEYSSLSPDNWGLPGILLAVHTSTVHIQNLKKAKKKKGWPAKYNWSRTDVKNVQKN